MQVLEWSIRCDKICESLVFWSPRAPEAQIPEPNGERTDSLRYFNRNALILLVNTLGCIDLYPAARGGCLVVLGTVAPHYVPKAPTSTYTQRQQNNRAAHTTLSSMGTALKTWGMHHFRYKLFNRSYETRPGIAIPRDTSANTSQSSRTPSNSLIQQKTPSTLTLQTSKKPSTMLARGEQIRTTSPRCASRPSPSSKWSCTRAQAALSKSWASCWAR